MQVVCAGGHDSAMHQDSHFFRAPLLQATGSLLVLHVPISLSFGIPGERSAGPAICTDQSLGSCLALTGENGLGVPD